MVGWIAACAEGATDPVAEPEDDSSFNPNGTASSSASGGTAGAGPTTAPASTTTTNVATTGAGGAQGGADASGGGVGAGDGSGVGGAGGNPTGGGTGDCCVLSDTPGCSDPAVESCVCAHDSYCCDDIWDALCAQYVEYLSCGTCP